MANHTGRSRHTALDNIEVNKVSAEVQFLELVLETIEEIERREITPDSLELFREQAIDRLCTVAENPAFEVACPDGVTVKGIAIRYLEEAKQPILLNA